MLFDLIETLLTLFVFNCLVFEISSTILEQSRREADICLDPRLRVIYARGQELVHVIVNSDSAFRDMF
jgi:hypothetical protein